MTDSAPAAPAAGRPAGAEPLSTPGTGTERATGPSGRPAAAAWAVAAGGAGCAALLAGHRLVPNVLGAGSLLETFLPWLGVPVLVLAVAAAALRSVRAGVAVLAGVVVWAVLFGPALVSAATGPGGAPGPAGGADLRVLTHNLWERNPRVAQTARTLAASGADVVAVQEVRPEWLAAFAGPLDEAYPHRDVLETYGVWSRHPISAVRAVDTALGAHVAVRLVLTTPKGPVTLYNVHLIAPAVGKRGFGGTRDAALREVTDAVAADTAERVLLVGDLNTAPGDRRARRLLTLLDSAQDRAGSGFGFTWPARLPLARIDHVLTRGLRAEEVRVLDRTGSDHLPVLASLRM
jgi:vancomycin resistance protein VanJ